MPLSELSEQNITAQERERIIQVLLAALKEDLQVAAMTGGRTSLQSVFFNFQLGLTLKHGEVYVAGQSGSIDGILFVYGPGQDFAFHESSSSPNALSHEYVSKLPLELQQWWTTHFRPKFAELTSTAMGGNEARKAAWHVLSIAVHPARQHLGICRRLLETVLHKADAGRQRSCLEVNNDVLVRIFIKFGFIVRATKNFGSYQGGFPLFSMLRDPGP